MLSEDIANPPHMWHQWLEKQKTITKELEAALRPYELIDQAIEQEEYELGIEDGFFSILSQAYPGWELKRILEKEYGTGLSYSIETYELFKDTIDHIKYLRYLNLYDTLNQNNVIEEWEKAYNKAKEEGLSKSDYKYLYNQGDITKEFYATAIKGIQLAENIKRYLDHVKRFSQAIKAALERIQIRRQKSSTGEQQLPAHEQIETLYHATPFVKEILTQGFKTKEELSQEGLGGHTGNNISFTADLEIAKDIAISLKEVILIAQGKIQLSDIMDLARKEKLQTLISDAKLTLHYAKKQNRKIKRSDIFELYKRYLSYSPTRYNPVYWGVEIENFQNLDIKNVGVIASKVDIEQTAEYLDSMEEYRVPVSAIKTIQQIL